MSAVSECALLAGFSASLRGHEALAARTNASTDCGHKVPVGAPPLRVLDASGSLAGYVRAAASVCAGAEVCVTCAACAGAPPPRQHFVPVADGKVDAELSAGQASFARAFSQWAAGGDGGLSHAVLAGNLGHSNSNRQSRWRGSGHSRSRRKGIDTVNLDDLHSTVDQDDAP